MCEMYIRYEPNAINIRAEYVRCTVFPALPQQAPQREAYFPEQAPFQARAWYGDAWGEHGTAVLIWLYGGFKGIYLPCDLHYLFLIHSDAWSEDRHING